VKLDLTERNDTPFIFVMPASLKAQAEEVCKSAGISMSHYLRFLLRADLAAGGPKAQEAAEVARS
jgi:hypothetical protein